MKLNRGQKLFEALQNVCDFAALESEMDEIIRAAEYDNQCALPTVMYRDFLIWLSYNTGRNTDFRSKAIGLSNEFEKATKGSHKYCECLNSGKAVNEYWNEWHCVYCLRIKKK